jgi:hypothetical protein
MIVVQEQVVEAAQKHAVLDIGGAVVALPLLGVMRLGEGGRPGAVGPEASAVAQGERFALTPVVEPAGAAVIGASQGSSSASPGC